MLSLIEQRQNKWPKASEIDLSKAESSLRAVDKHLERMHMIRMKKEINERVQAKQPGSGKNWTNKLTVPKAPKISANSKVQKEK